MMTLQYDGPACVCRVGAPSCIYLLSADDALVELFKTVWPDEDISFHVFTEGRFAIESLFTDPPELLIIDEGLPDVSAPELTSLVKSENVYRQVPVLLCVRGDLSCSKVDFSTVEVDEFICEPYTRAEIAARICLTLNRASRALDANPLSKLPGNTSIISRIQSIIGGREDFALAYVDLDSFKPFNDKYGFARGDEVLMMTSRIIVNTIRSFPGIQSFVGHVGGDDFVFIVPADVAAPACKRIIQNFDSIIPHFYDEEDRERGAIRSKDRDGNVRDFPLMGISIAVVVNEEGRLHHYGEASLLAMQLKKKAKSHTGSIYVLG